MEPWFPSVRYPRRVADRIRAVCMHMLCIGNRQVIQISSLLDRGVASDRRRAPERAVRAPTAGSLGHVDGRPFGAPGRGCRPPLAAEAATLRRADIGAFGAQQAAARRPHRGRWRLATGAETTPCPSLGQTTLPALPKRACPARSADWPCSPRICVRIEQALAIGRHFAD